VRCPFFQAGLNPLPDSGCLSMHSGECVTHRAPLRYRRLYAWPRLATRPCECPASEACCLVRQAVHQVRRSLLSRTLSGLRIGPPQRSEKLAPSRLAAVSRLARLSHSFRREENCQSFRPSGLHDELALTAASQLVFCRSAVATCATLFRLTGLVPAWTPHLTHARWFIMPRTLLPASSLNSWSEPKSGFSSGEAAIIDRRYLPILGWSRSIDIRRIRFWLAPRASLRIDCRDQQNACAICSNNPPFRAAVRAIHCWTAVCVAITVSSTTATCLRLSPLAPATWLQFEASDRACAPSSSSNTVLITTACRLFRKRLGFPLSTSSAWSPACASPHACSLTNSRPFDRLFSPQAWAVKLVPTFNLPGFSDIDSLRRLIS